MKLDKSVEEQGVKATDARCCVFILCMHRSGTSALSRTLSLLGCDLPNAQITATDGNEAGHWEPAAIVALNDALLASAGSRWNDWLPVNPRWYDSPVHAGFLARARETLAAVYAGSPLFVLKDPRNCRLARFWYEAFEAEGIDPVTVISLRNPLEVAKSLEVRDEMEPGYGELLWLRHMLDAEQMSRHKRRCVVEYGQLLSDWSVPMGRLQRETGLTLPRFSPMVDAEIGAFLSGKLRHHDLGRNSVLESPLISDWLKRSYEIFTRWSTDGEDHTDHAALDGIRAEFDGSAAAFARLVMPGSRSGEAGDGLRLQAQREDLLGKLAQAAHDAEALENLAGAVERELAEREVQLAAAIAARDSLTERQGDLENMLRQRQEEIHQAWAELERERAASESLRGELSEVRGQLELHQGKAKESADWIFRLAAERRAGEDEIARLSRQLGLAEKAEKRAHDDLRRVEGARAAFLSQNAAHEQALGVHSVDSKALKAKPLEAGEIGKVRLAQSESALAKLGQECREQAALREKLAGALSSERQRHEIENSEKISEIITLTSLLRDREDRIASETARMEWLRQVQKIVASQPWWWAYLPGRARQRLVAQRLTARELFDGSAYLERYPDVDDAGMDPLFHYIHYGMSEGRVRTV